MCVNAMYLCMLFVCVCVPDTLILCFEVAIRSGRLVDMISK